MQPQTPSWTESIGIVLYLGSLLYLSLQPANVVAPQIPWVIGAVIGGGLLMSFPKGLVSARTAGILLATWGLFWQLSVMRMKPATAGNTLILSGLLCLVGFMLLARAQRIIPWVGTALGWGSVAALWLSTRVGFGHFIIPILGIVVVLASLQKRA